MNRPPAMSPDLETWWARGRLWPWRGHRIFVAQAGQGPVTVLLHGYPTGSYDWWPLWLRLAAQSQLIAPDFLGLGFSDKPERGRYGLADHADLVLDLLHEQGVRSVAFVAHDLGVSVVQEILARQREGAVALEVRAVALLNGGLCPAAYRPRWIQRLLASPLGAWIGPQVSRPVFERTLRALFVVPPPPALIDDFWLLLEHQQGRRVTHRVGAFWRERLAHAQRLVAPLLEVGAPPLRLINGSDDPNSGRHMVDAFLALRPEVDLVRIAGTGHWPHWEATETVWHALAPFLARHTHAQAV